MQRIVSCSAMRLEYGAQLVKAVGPHAEDAEIEIDLRVRADRDDTAMIHVASSSPHERSAVAQFVERDRLGAAAAR